MAASRSAVSFACASVSFSSRNSSALSPENSLSWMRKSRRASLNRLMSLWFSARAVTKTSTWALVARTHN